MPNSPEHVIVSKYRTTKPALPSPVAEAWYWQLSARCRGKSSDGFFSPSDLRGAALDRFNADAKRTCGQCPVMAQCRSYAIESAEPYGVWGGLTAKERALLRSDDP
ncbi:hypothetical protein ASG56_06235 [Rhodococcus sp. Leaf7]|uniref:WhiB family transcriptional regulator n=1 Tax=unclassified Rhodococcus (in: high G+C Gram-positive bacteria) TaxID=192944 RepID=UPI0007010AEA|nr:MULTISPECIES: WhiB family transcriptional regulator [unclassified Rhodococcus (in: high G+C Gram-positive bacteria)]KQU07138.1 hypothetical protein ASG56_06235 [Rhodococcus sp. Leaf7]KQU42656.1 hypothetical protein ASG64_06235 [Rhodococcus sp. Leaf247]